jgi:hypothetical protein
MNHSIAIDLLDQSRAIVDFPDHVRAVLVSLGVAGSVYTQEVESDCSVLNIERDLIKHLSDYPFSERWLIGLRDYLDRRILEEAQSRREGSMVQLGSADTARDRLASGDQQEQASRDTVDAERWRTWLSLLGNHRPTLGLPPGTSESVDVFVSTIDALRGGATLPSAGVEG